MNKELQIYRCVRFTISIYYKTLQYFDMFITYNNTIKTIL